MIPYEEVAYQIRFTKLDNGYLLEILTYLGAALRKTYVENLERGMQIVGDRIEMEVRKRFQDDA